jgi:hypothetical protein
MAKRAKPAWGNLGVVCIRGAGQTDRTAAVGLVTRSLTVSPRISRLRNQH